MTEPFFTIVNGAAGGGRCRARADQATRRLRDGGVRLEVHLTEGRGHATELAEEAYEAGHRRFISIGGDGTSYEIVNGLFPRAQAEGERVQMGMLPLGTGNSFLRDFGITNEDAAFDAIVRGRTHPVDVVRVTHRDGTLHYINTLGLGFVPRAGAMTNQHFKALGTAGYIAAVVACTADLRYLRTRYRFTLYGDESALGEAPLEERANTFVSFSNSKYTGGAMMMAPNADCSDGALDVVRVNRLSRLDLITTFPKIFTGTFVEHPAVEQARASAVRFEGTGTQDVLVDGEQLELELQQLDVLPQALEVLS
ncbi:MAG: YegS/Rv2252/BmrU family lipid kinase [Sandaracinaceae bacterium]|nr:YegS/Rv2252/BmrU family lipid kinase [Sandaracinaceae bacterium]